MLVAVFYHPHDFRNVRSAEVSHQSSLSCHALFELFLGVASAETQVDEVGGRQRAGPFGREGAFAVERVVGIDGPAVFVGGHRYAAAEVANDEVQVLILFPDALGVPPCNGALVQSVPDADARHERRPADAGFRQQLVHHARVGNVCLAARAEFGGQFGGDDAAQVAGVFSHGVVSVVAHLAVHAVNASPHRLGQSAAPDDGIEAEGDVVFLEPVEYDLPAEVLLVHYLLKQFQFLGFVAYGRYPKRRIANVYGHFR